MDGPFPLIPRPAILHIPPLLVHPEGEKNGGKELRKVDTKGGLFCKIVNKISGEILRKKQNGLLLYLVVLLQQQLLTLFL